MKKFIRFLVVTILSPMTIVGIILTAIFTYLHDNDWDYFHEYWDDSLLIRWLLFKD